MRCKMCRNEIVGNSIQTKNGCICQGCYDQLPNSIKASIRSFTVQQLKEVKTVIGEPFERSWVECGRLKLCMESIILNGFAIKLKDIKRISLNFHPKYPWNAARTVMGTVTVVIETKSPHIILEEPFFDRDIKAVYTIYGKNITYTYSYELEKLVREVQKAVDADTDLYDAAARYSEEVGRRKEAEAAKQKKAEAERKAREEAARRQAEEDRKRKEKIKNEKQRNQNRYTGGYAKKAQEPLTPFEQAKKMFGVELPFTLKELDSRKKELAKKYHPDMGGDTETFQQIMEYYEMLKKYAN